MTRAALTYGETRQHRRFEGISASEPVPGFYRCKLVSGGVTGAVRIWHGPPHDPVTGEEMDRSWRWQAEFEGEYIDLDRVWPVCAGDPISESEYRQYIARARWAKNHAPTSPYARRFKRVDFLDAQAPLDF